MKTVRKPCKWIQDINETIIHLSTTLHARLLKSNHIDRYLNFLIANELNYVFNP